MLDKKQRTAFLNYCRLYFSKYVHCDMRFLVEKNSALLCFLGGFGIVVPLFSYLKHPTPSSIVKKLYQIVVYQMVQNYLIS